MASLYIHIPFCLGKCRYCSFSSYPGLEALFPRYVEAVKTELGRHAQASVVGELDTVFFGGGTPSILSTGQIGEILRCCRACFGIASQAEITVEVNPKTVDFIKMLQLRQTGVNRLSIGVQSFVDRELQTLGRLHSAQDGWECVIQAAAAGFAAISIDLIYGLPSQSPEQWRWSLDSVLALDIVHLSCYQLSIEEHTPFHDSHRRGDLILPDDDDILRMDEATIGLCTAKGLQQYEISNFAVPGTECRHNLNYWHNRDYLAVGAGAVGYLGGRRTRNLPDPRAYCDAVEAGENHIVESEILTPEASFRETVVMGLRLVAGVSCATLFERFGIDLQSYYADTLTPLLENDLVEFSETHFRLTKKGRHLANQVLAELV